MAVTQRLQKLRQRLLEEGLEGILISQPENCRYLSGFTGSGALLISQDSAILAAYFIYLEQAEREAADFEIVRIKSESYPAGLVELISKWEIKSLGFEASLNYADYRRLAEEADKLKLQLIPTEGLVDSLRAVKEEEEVACLIEAAELADDALEYISQEIHPGMKEKEVAWEIEKFLREKGSEPTPFDVIVASGPNAALPHAKPTGRTISLGEPIIVDLGARVEGYSSDLSRTLCLGSWEENFTKIYNLVLQAQLSAIANLEARMTGEQVDNLARAIIQREGYEGAFGHGLGHGIGLATHEEPRLGPGSGDIIAENMVFTIEPGVYLSGWGGVRIEDMVIVEKGKAKTLTKVRK
ncbi:MAG: aminopeptidase P family protein [Dehalococcoidia bacterium]|nr:MAG: aminopeptidase P family protein [Dehalococcoidia bacterium]